MNGCSCPALGADRDMKYKLTICVFALAIALFAAGISAAAPYFRGTGLMNTPSAYVMQQGIFDAGVHITVSDQKREELAVRIDFGMFNFIELGLMGLKADDDDYVLGNLKILLFHESGSTPSLSIGLDNFGEKAENFSESYQRSLYGVISKQFNLPILHIISGHLGIGNRRYVSETSAGKYLHGVFLGLTKELYLSFLDSRLRLMCELDGSDLNMGIQYAMSSGLSVNFAVGQLDSAPEGIKYYLGVSFTNEPSLNDIDQISKQVMKAVTLINQARSDTDK
jgi:hypothetical protein